MTPRLKQAVKSGLLAYVFTALVLALFASPLLATHFDFGHLHPDNAPAHVHTLSSIFDVGQVGSSPSFTLVTVFFIGAVFTRALFVDEPPTHPVGSRAPPVVT